MFDVARSSRSMFVWRKSASQDWLDVNEGALHLTSGNRLVVVRRPNRKRFELEIVCNSAKEARSFIDKFGGKIDKLARDWLERFARNLGNKPIKIGRRLIILRSRNKREANKFPYSLIIPAGAAFGTGDHATTAMSLRLLEKVSRKLRAGWSMVDLGTGSGILALAAKRFEAKRVVAIDNDPGAIATARQNARINEIDNVDFQIADVRRWRSSHRIDVVTANLLSELLIEMLPKLKSARRLILSGILGKQEGEMRRALRASKIDMAKVWRRGKWIAILARPREAS